MKCPSCKNEVETESSFCYTCGTDLRPFKKKDEEIHLADMSKYFNQSKRDEKVYKSNLMIAVSRADFTSWSLAAYIISLIVNFSYLLRSAYQFSMSNRDLFNMLIVVVATACFIAWGKYLSRDEDNGMAHVGISALLILSYIIPARSIYAIIMLFVIIVSFMIQFKIFGDISYQLTDSRSRVSRLKENPERLRKTVITGLIILIVMVAILIYGGNSHTCDLCGKTFRGHGYSNMITAEVRSGLLCEDCASYEYGADYLRYRR